MDYVDFARSKGITSGEVRTRHVMRNAMISTVTLLSMRMAAMLGGSVIIETVFSVPGIGKLASDASSAGLCGGAVCGAALCGAGAGHQSDHRYPLFLPGSPGQSVERGVRMKRYHGVSPLEQKRSMPAWLAKPLS